MERFFTAILATVAIAVFTSPMPDLSAQTNKSMGGLGQDKYKSVFANIATDTIPAACATDISSTSRESTDAGFVSLFQVGSI